MSMLSRVRSVWNKTAEDCYKRGCICSGCPIYELYFEPYNLKCQMKVAVIEMVRIYGLPEHLKKKENEIICQKNIFRTI